MNTEDTATKEQTTPPLEQVLDAVLPNDINEKLKNVEEKITLDSIKARPLSYSSLKHFKRSPMHFAEYRGRLDQEETAALIFGNLLDCLLLTPWEFDNRYTVAVRPIKNAPPALLLKYVGREKYDAYKIELEKAEKEFKEKMDKYNALINDASRIIVTQGDVDKAKAMCEAIRKNPTARKMIERVTEVQVERRWVDKKTGLPVLCRMDGSGEDLIFELKTAANADPEEFYKDAYKFQYPLQCGMELESFRVKNKFPQFWYIVIEKTAPYGVSVFQPTDDYIELGKLEYRSYMDSFKYCLDNDKFTEGYEFKSSRADKTHALDLPPWARQRLEQLKGQ